MRADEGLLFAETGVLDGAGRKEKQHQGYGRMPGNPVSWSLLAVQLASRSEGTARSHKQTQPLNTCATTASGCRAFGARAGSVTQPEGGRAFGFALFASCSTIV